MTIKDCEKIVGKLSKPSKMPCFGYSIPAIYCHIGRKMRGVLNSICSKCYALKGRYVFKSVRQAMEKRFQSLDDPLWVNVMAALIQKKEKSGFFRWHDSGDLQSVGHLDNICLVAEFLPHIKFWLPTREYNIVVERHELYGDFPDNLTVRLSGLYLDGKPPTERQNPLGLPTSSAHKTDFNCPAPFQDGKCLDCRLCWDKNTHVIYKQH